METLPFGGTFFRVADPSWADPVDAPYAARPPGQRWNPPGVDCLYLNVDIDTARANVRRLFVGQPAQPEDLDPAAAPVLVQVTIPDGLALDATSTIGLAAIGLPDTFPLDDAGGLIQHQLCQPHGVASLEAGHDGVLARSAAPGGTQELAWFPLGRLPAVDTTESFDTWF